MYAPLQCTGWFSAQLHWEQVSGVCCVYSVIVFYTLLFSSCSFEMSCYCGDKILDLVDNWLVCGNDYYVYVRFLVPVCSHRITQNGLCDF